VPRHIKNAAGNLLWRWLRVSDNAEHEKKSLAFDGLLLWLLVNTDLEYKPDNESKTPKNKPGDNQKKSRKMVCPVENFTLIDYIYHEMYTGISLSIEITAVLLEFEDEILAEEALKAFQKHALKDIVFSPMLFTRICAARHFFQQILMEKMVDQYGWTSLEKSVQDEERQWKQRVNRACAHIGSAYKPVLCYVQDLEIDEALMHLTMLITKMKQPVDLFGYVNNPEHGLAVFCNPNHKNAKFFLDELKTGQEQKLQKDRRSSRREIRLFRKVHEMVRKAIWDLEKQRRGMSRKILYGRKKDRMAIAEHWEQLKAMGCRLAYNQKRYYRKKGMS
jgi:hypothetical protein